MVSKLDYTWKIPGCFLKKLLHSALLSKPIKSEFQGWGPDISIPIFLNGSNMRLWLRVIALNAQDPKLKSLLNVLQRTWRNFFPATYWETWVPYPHLWSLLFLLYFFSINQLNWVQFLLRTYIVTKEFWKIHLPM